MLLKPFAGERYIQNRATTTKNWQRPQKFCRPLSALTTFPCLLIPLASHFFRYPLAPSSNATGSYVLYFCDLDLLPIYFSLCVFCLRSDRGMTDFQRANKNQFLVQQAATLPGWGASRILALQAVPKSKLVSIIGDTKNTSEANGESDQTALPIKVNCESHSTEEHKLGTLYSVSIAGLDLTGSCLYTAGVATVNAGKVTDRTFQSLKCNNFNNYAIFIHSWPLSHSSP